jgi:hypothetical protein
MISNFIVSALLKVLDDPKVDQFVENLADKVATKVIAALGDDLKGLLDK